MKTKPNKSLKKSGLGLIRRNSTAWLLLLPSVLLFYFFVWRPIGIGFMYSFFKLQNYVPTQFVGFDNYREVVTDMLFVKTLTNSFKYVLWSFVIGFVPPILFAVMINEIVHMNGFIKFSIYFPQIVPVVAAALIWYFLYLPGESGVLNILLGKLGLPANDWLQNANQTIPLIIIMMTWQGCGGSMILYLASLQGINQELYEAAKMDGAGVIRRFECVTFPAIFPIVLLQFVRQIIGVFQVMIEPMTLTDGGPNNASVSLNLQGFKYAFQNFQPERALALGVITFIILIVVTCFYFRLQKKLGE
ncbi:MAG: sugar ABC transporter permease [Clostridiales bacterium]|nr:sugar ABC transporter permease [Clostridiales bacterium]